MELAHRILEHIAQSHDGGVMLTPINPKELGDSSQQVSYHLALLDDAGNLLRMDNGDALPPLTTAGLTWTGHDFLEQLRRQHSRRNTPTIPPAVVVSGESLPEEF